MFYYQTTLIFCETNPIQCFKLKWWLKQFSVAPLLLEDWASTHVSLLWHQRGTCLLYHDSTSCSSKVLIIISPASFRLVTFVVLFTKLQKPYHRHRSDILFDGVVGPHHQKHPPPAWKSHLFHGGSKRFFFGEKPGFSQRISHAEVKGAKLVEAFFSVTMASKGPKKGSGERTSSRHPAEVRKSFSIQRFGNFETSNRSHQKSLRNSPSFFAPQTVGSHVSKNWTGFPGRARQI